MSIAVVANTAKSSGNLNNVTSDAIDTTGASLLVVSVSFYGAGGGSPISDSKGNTWTPLTQRGFSNATSCWLFYAVNPTVGAGHTFTATLSGQGPAIFVLVLSGADTSAPFDVENGAASASGATIQTGSVTPSTDDQIFIAALCSLADGTNTINLGFTISDQLPFVSGLALCGALAHMIQTSAAAKNPTWTHSASSEQAAAIATFKAAAGGGGTFTLTADSGSFAFTGQAATLKADRTLPAASGSFALTGQAASLRAARNLPADSGSFTLTGQSATPRADRKLPAASGAYALTGQNVNFLTEGDILDAESGSFALTGQTATLRAARLLSAASGSYALTGQSATLTYSGAAADATTPIYWARRPEVCRGARRPEVGRGARRALP